jgi:hypothetical protein
VGPPVDALDDYLAGNEHQMALLMSADTPIGSRDTPHRRPLAPQWSDVIKVADLIAGLVCVRFNVFPLCYKFPP